MEIGSSYQNRSPLFRRTNWSVSRQANVGPTAAPGSGGSSSPPTYRSRCSIDLMEERDGQLNLVQEGAELVTTVDVQSLHNYEGIPKGVISHLTSTLFFKATSDLF